MLQPELVAREGYPIELHKVETDDGYILEVHRIPLPGSKKPPVYLQHGILCSSSDWVIAGPEKGLAYILHRLGYDVWMGNFRGNRYSRSHRDRDNMDPDRNVRQFWDFSFHEKGVYDVPATIDYILERTDHSDLMYIGHSMGTTAFFIMLSERPAYNVKVRSMSALAPVSYMTQVQSPLLRVAALLSTPLGAAANLVGIREFLPNNLLFTLAGQVLCKERAITQALCYNIMFLCTGFNSPQLNLTLLPTLLAHMPAGASVKTLIHYGQLIRSGTFRRYDYGLVRNLWHYGSTRPPAYNLDNVRVPVSLHYSDNDWVSGPRDVHALYDSLPNRNGRFRVKLPQFNHVDFLWGVDAPSLVYDTLTEILESQATRSPPTRR
ncbi:Lipase 3-like [Frankliniella occidentalis]|uniref:Lipase n=1 Tax=Frankliniella occidentalis TaxID=133901 RepID=A0A9C6U0A8_FRAOC|nr:lipase 3-like [Frankliniella occidentalis]KAE8750091.1 Lipase 3-like [Frankliniella occidentalis]